MRPLLRGGAEEVASEAASFQTKAFPASRDIVFPHGGQKTDWSTVCKGTSASKCHGTSVFGLLIHSPKCSPVLAGWRTLKTVAAKADVSVLSARILKSV